MLTRAEGPIRDALHPVTGHGPWVKLDEVIAINPSRTDPGEEAWTGIEIFLANGQVVAVTCDDPVAESARLAAEVALDRHRREHGEDAAPRRKAL